MSAPSLSWGGPVLDGSTWQGVEYLSADFDAPGFAAVVTAHLARPASGLSVDDVTVGGGEKLTNLPYQAEITDGDDFFVVRFPERGDRAPYSIGLANGGDDPLHPFFRAASFSFYVDCPAGDCRDRPGLPLPTPHRVPALDTLHKDFRGFLQTLSEWVRVHAPLWADLSEASLERVLLDLLAHQGDHLSYYQDRVANEAFIDTATQRYSMRQHATLLGYRPDDGRAATTTLAFRAGADGFVPEGLVVETPHTADEAGIAFTTAERVRVRPENDWLTLRPAAWPGAHDALLPAGATELLLWDQAHRLAPGQRIALALDGFSQVVELTAVETVSEAGWVASPEDPPHAALQPLTRLRWAEPLAVDLQPWSSAGEPRLTLYANLVDAVHGRPKRLWLFPAGTPAEGDAVLGLDDLDGRNSVLVPRVLGGHEVTQLRALRLPERPVLFDGDGEPAVEVRVDGEPWTRVETLGASRSFDPHYVATADEDGSLWLQLGDGEHGRDVRLVTRPARREAADPSHLTVEALAPGARGTRLRVAFAPPSDGDPTHFRLAVFDDPPGPAPPVLVEDWDDLSVDPAAPRYALTLLLGSRYVRSAVADPPLAAPPAPEPGLPPAPTEADLRNASVALARDADVEIEVCYRIGEPLAGNCALDALTRVADRQEADAVAALQELGAVAVTNVVPGSGGRRPESREALRLAIPTSLRHGPLERAVALDDYARAALESDPRVARAAARDLGGPFRAVLVLVDPKEQGDLDEDLRRSVFDALDRLRMAGRELFVDRPDYVPLEVELLLCVDPGFLPHEVRDRVLRELRPGTAERPGWFHPDRLSFGEDVELGDVLAFVQRLAGVRSVKATRFRRLGLAPPSAAAATDDEAEVVERIELGTTEVARLDADENFPEDGVLRVLLTGNDGGGPALHRVSGPLDSPGSSGPGPVGGGW